MRTVPDERPPGSPDNADVPVVILAGGLGTRLRQQTEHVPKPMVRIGDEPLLWHIMKLYAHHGFRRFVLCLGYRGEVVTEYFLTYRQRHADLRIDLSGACEPEYLGGRAEPWEVVCAQTGLHTGTGARVRRVRDHLDADVFLCTYGDGIGPVDVQGLLDHHRAHSRAATVTGVRPAGRYGEMEVSGDVVLEFNEKPATSRTMVSGGFFVFDREVLDRLDGDDDLTLEQEPLRKLARDGELSVFEHEGFWLGMDTHRELTELDRLWQSGKAPWKVWAD